MQQNVCSTDRIVRAAAGLGIIAWGVATQNWLGAAGAIPLMTAVIGWCPAYLPFGLSSCRVKG